MTTPPIQQGAGRLDLALVERGLARSRGVARELIDDGRVRVGGVPAGKASLQVGADDEVTVIDPGPVWVGRGAEKLLAALEHWPQLAVAGRRAADVGASTGGFTQVLLQRGIAAVVAIDVGHGQLAEPVRRDPRVIDREGTTIRGLTADDIGGPVDLLVADLSFISLASVIPDLVGLCADEADLMLLVKPQFEVGRERLGKKGIVRSEANRRAALRGVVEASQQAGLAYLGLMASPMTGTHGNREFLLWLARTRGAVGGTWQAVLTDIDNATRTGQ